MLPNILLRLKGGGLAKWCDKSQIIFLAPEIEEAYIPNSSDNGIAHGDVFFGITRSLSPTFQGRFGLALAAAGSARPAGTILIMLKNSMTITHTLTNCRIVMLP